MAIERDKREIIRVGKASYAITIPKKLRGELGIDLSELIELVKYSDSIVMFLPLRGEGEQKEVTGLRITLDANKKIPKQLIEEVISRRSKPLCREPASIADFLAVMRMTSDPEFSRLVLEYREAEKSGASA